MNKSQEAIQEILEKDISWYDYENLNTEKKKAYFSEAQRLLRSDVLINEINAFISGLVKEIAYNSENYDKVVALRYSINGVKALMERLESIKDPNNEIVVEEPYSAI